MGSGPPLPSSTTAGTTSIGASKDSPVAGRRSARLRCANHDRDDAALVGTDDKTIDVVNAQSSRSPRLADAYHPGNSMPVASLRVWTELIGSVSLVPRPALVDVGAGIGVFAVALAEWRDAVLTVDPSPAMLRGCAGPQALAGAYVAGDATSLPPPPMACLIWRCCRVLFTICRTGGAAPVSLTGCSARAWR